MRRCIFGALFLVLSIAILPARAHAQFCVYATSQDPARSVAVVDPSTCTNIVDIPFDPLIADAQHIAITPDGSRAYVTNTSSATVSVIDTSGALVIATVSLPLAQSGFGYRPRGIAIAPDGTPSAGRAYVSGSDPLPNGDPGAVMVIDTTTNSVVATCPLTCAPATCPADGNTNPYAVAIHPDGSRAYVTKYDTAEVEVLDISNADPTVCPPLVTSPISVGPNPWAIAMRPDGVHAWVADRDEPSSNGSISIIETTTNTVVHTIGPISTSADICFKPDSSRAYHLVNDGGVGNVEEYDATLLPPMRVSPAITTQHENRWGCDIASNGDFLAKASKDIVTLVDLLTRQQTCTASCGSRCWDVAIGPCPLTICGDGLVEPPEDCDDGNQTPGDGCSSSCSVESGWSCSSVCTEMCGDGIIVGSEACDDGNLTDTDGCSSTCTVEPGWVCTGAPSTCTECGDGVSDAGEGCDDGNVADGDGCSSVCTIEPGWVCSAQPSACTAEQCGDGFIAGSEQCDDGNMADGDGCSSACAVEPCCVCEGAPSICTVTPCGNGAIEGNEQCDDSNTVDGDGCDSNCMLEPGSCCVGAPSVCTTVCASPDHLACYKIKDELKLKGIVNIDAPQLTGLGPSCKISKAKLFCAPATKEVVEATAGGDPITLLPIFETGNLTDAHRICYKVRCSRQDILDQEVSDQFGNRMLTRFKKAQLLCVPALKGPPPPP